MQGNVPYMDPMGWDMKHIKRYQVSVERIFTGPTYSFFLDLGLKSGYCKC